MTLCAVRLMSDLPNVFDNAYIEPTGLSQGSHFSVQMSEVSKKINKC